MNLKELGKKIANISGIVLGYGSIFAAATPTSKDDQIIAKLSDTSLKIADLVLVADGFGQALKLEGPAKLDGITGSVAQVIQQSELLIGKEIIDQVEFTAGVREIASGYAKVLKAVKRK